MRLGFFIADQGQWGVLDPADVEPGGRGVGGRETALIYLSRILAERGHEVEVFARCKPQTSEAGVLWRDVRGIERVGQRAYDVAVSFAGPAVWARGLFPGRYHVVHEQCAHLDVGNMDELVDRYFVLSDWQGWHLNHYDPAIDTNKMVTVGNGVDLRRYEVAGVERAPHRVFYSSSPDRGLHHLLSGWRLVREQVPDAELWVMYEVGKWIEGVRWFMNDLGRRAQIVRMYYEDEPGTDGITFWGMLDKWTLAEKQMECALWAYPADLTAGTETFCITGVEAAAAGCALLATDGDCLPEIYGEVAGLVGLPTDGALFAGAVVKMLTDPAMAAQYTPGMEFARLHTWERVADRWEEALAGLEG